MYELVKSSKAYIGFSQKNRLFVKVQTKSPLTQRRPRRTYLQKRLNSSVCVYSALSDYMLALYRPIL